MPGIWIMHRRRRGSTRVKAYTYEEILSDSQVDMVVVLTGQSCIMA